MTLPLITSKRDYLLGRGKIYVDIFNALGNKVGERFLGNTPGFTLSVATTSVQHFSSMEASRPQDLDTPISVAFSASITCDDITDDNLALYIAGLVSTVTQAATPVTAEHVTVITGREYQLGATANNPLGVRNVTAVTVKDTAGTTTYVAGTDYSVDLTSGRVAIIAGGAIDDLDDVQFGYTPVAGTRKRVATGAAGSTTGALRFIADNKVGSNRVVYIPSASFSASGDMPFIGENDFATMTIGVGVNQKDSATPQVLIEAPLVLP